MKFASHCLVAAIVSVFGFAAAPAQAGIFDRPPIRLPVDLSRPVKEVFRPIINPIPATSSTLPVEDPAYDLFWSNNFVWVRQVNNGQLLYQAAVRRDANGVAYCFDPQGRTGQQLRTPKYDLLTSAPWIDPANGAIVVTQTVNGVPQGHRQVGQASLQIAANGLRYWVGAGVAVLAR